MKMSFPVLRRTQSSADLYNNDPVPLFRTRAIHDPNYFSLMKYLHAREIYPTSVCIELTRLYTLKGDVEYEELIDYFKGKNILDNELETKLRELYNELDVIAE
jgi:hypothetical protein